MYVCVRFERPWQLLGVWSRSGEACVRVDSAARRAVSYTDRKEWRKARRLSASQCTGRPLLVGARRAVDGHNRRE
jgi:hypothetical protein